MRRAVFRRSATGMALFPFLAVLICTMGSLIVLLVLVLQQSRVQASVATATTRGAATTPAAEPAVDAEAAQRAEELARAKEDHDWRREMLAVQREEQLENLSRQRKELSHLEDHVRRLEDQWKKMAEEAKQFAKLADDKSEETKASQEELDKLKTELDAKKKEVEEKKANLSKGPKSYALVPYVGKNGTRRRPIYIECAEVGIILHPEGVVFLPSDFQGPLGPGNPLDAALRTVREHWAKQPDAAKDGEPYPLLIVRPNGAVAYSMARAAMKSWEEEFGYELVEESLELEFPPSDPELEHLLARSIKDARSRQQILAASMPSRYKPTQGELSGPGFTAPPHDETAALAANGGRSSGGGFGGTTGRTGGSGGFGTGAAGSTNGGGFGPGGGPNGGANTNALAGNGNGAGTGTGTGVGPGTGAGGTANGTNGGNGGFGFGAGSGNGGTGNNVAAGGTRGMNLDAGGGAPGSGGFNGVGGSGSGNTGMARGSGGAGGGGTAGGANGDPSANPAEFSGGGVGGGNAFAGGGRAAGGAGGAGNPGAAGGAGGAGASGGGTAGGMAGPGGLAGGSSGVGASNGATMSSPDGAQPGAMQTSASRGSGGGSGSSGSSSSGSNLSDGTGQASATFTPPSVARRRGQDWALRDKPQKATAITRPIRVRCLADRLVLVPERGDDQRMQVIPLQGDVSAALDPFVTAIWKQVDRWGLAVSNGYWKPVLNVEVGPGAEGNFQQLQALLQGSGLEVVRR